MLKTYMIKQNTHKTSQNPSKQYKTDYRLNFERITQFIHQTIQPNLGHCSREIWKRYWAPCIRRSVMDFGVMFVRLCRPQSSDSG